MENFYQDSASPAYPLPNSDLLEKHVQSPTFWHVPRRDPAKLGNSTKKRCIRKTSPEFHPPGKTLSDSNLLEIHNQDKLFLGNTFSTDPKSVHTQKPPLISTILAATTRIKHVLKKLLQAQNLPSPVSALFVYATQNWTPAQTLHANSYQNQKP